MGRIALVTVKLLERGREDRIHFDDAGARNPVMPGLTFFGPAGPEEAQKQSGGGDKGRKGADQGGAEIEGLPIHPHDFQAQNHSADSGAFPCPHPDMIRNPDQDEGGSFDVKHGQERADDERVDNRRQEAIPKPDAI